MFEDTRTNVGKPNGIEKTLRCKERKSGQVVYSSVGMVNKFMKMRVFGVYGSDLRASELP